MYYCEETNEYSMKRAMNIMDWAWVCGWEYCVVSKSIRYSAHKVSVVFICFAWQCLPCWMNLMAAIIMISTPPVPSALYRLSTFTAQMSKNHHASLLTQQKRR
jgi:hypothetical protein